MTSGICFKIIQEKKRERERKRLHKYHKLSVIVESGLGYWINRIYSFLMKVCLKINIIKFYSKKGKRNNARPKAKLFLK